jgi:type IV secretory pathway protease TraF
LTIRADDQSRGYGQENPALTFGYQGLVNGDTAVAVAPAISTAATAASPVGTYAITLEGGSDENYALILEPGTLEVSRAPLTIRADDQSRGYGQENPALTFGYQGLVNGDTAVAVAPAISTAATAASPVGTYAITLEGGSDEKLCPYPRTWHAGSQQGTIDHPCG